MNDDRLGATLSNQLVGFVCLYLAQLGIASPRHPEDWVRLGVEDAIATGIGTLEVSEEGLFRAFAAAIAIRIDRDLARNIEPPLSA